MALSVMIFWSWLVLNPLLFTKALEALSREIISGCPEGLLYGDAWALGSESCDGWSKFMDLNYLS